MNHTHVDSFGVTIVNQTSPFLDLFSVTTLRPALFFPLFLLLLSLSPIATALIPLRHLFY